MTSGEVWVALAVAVDIAFRIVALVIVPRNRRPQTAMAWLLAIFFIPYFGFLAFIAFGSRRLPKKRRQKQVAINAHVRNRSTLLDDGIVVTPENISNRPEFPRWLAQTVRMNEHLGAMPMVAGNSLDFFPDYEASLAEMAAAIRRARTTVHVEFYIMSFDEVTQDFFAAMGDAVSRGVTVRVLYDQLASFRIAGYRNFVAELTRLGVQYRAMLPVQPWRGVYQRPDLRNHRKLLIVDSDTAYTGSQNIIEPHYRKKSHRLRGLTWLDLMVRVRGPLADSLETLFVSDWYQETGELLDTPKPRSNNSAVEGKNVWAQVVPSGPAFEGENNLRLFNSMVYGARQRLIISSPYFVPDESMRYAITTAAERGVEVNIMMSEIADQRLVFHAQRSYYDELLAAGVKIWLYRAPTILHAKFIIVDDSMSVIGSSNIDMRSFSLNLEVSVLLASPSVVQELDALYETYRANSRPLTVEGWQARPLYQRFVEGLARLTATVQ
jgi:cardiolipin synthase